MFICKYCDKECKNDNSLRNHERLCKLNPNRQYTPFSEPNFNKICKKNYRNGYTKAKDEGRIYTISKETSKKISDSSKSRTKEWNKENGKKISKAIQEKVKNNTWHTSLAKNMHYNYNGIDLHGKWELNYAKYLDYNNIRWERCKESFEYIFENKIRHYTPDFYLLDSDEYIEIKGYKTNKDEAKWSQFPNNKKLKIFMKNDLKKLNISL